MSRAGEWVEFAVDAYLDHRYKNCVLAEELGDVIFVAARGVVLVHRERAEHIAEALGARADAVRLEQFVPLPAPAPVRQPVMRGPPAWTVSC